MLCDRSQKKKKQTEESSIEKEYSGWSYESRKESIEKTWKEIVQEIKQKEKEIEKILDNEKKDSVKRKYTGKKKGLNPLAVNSICSLIYQGPIQLISLIKRYSLE